jgi:hypothetical protein
MVHDNYILDIKHSVHSQMKLIVKPVTTEATLVTAVRIGSEENAWTKDTSS